MLKPITNISKFLSKKRAGKGKEFNHIAVSLEGGADEASYCDELNINAQELFERKGRIINEIAIAQAEMDIPIISVFLLSGKKVLGDFPFKIDNLIFSLRAIDLDFIIKNQIKVSAIGKWYELPQDCLDEIKSLIEETRDFDKYFFNLCINYDGQKEMEDVCKIIARKIMSERINVDSIDRQEIKDNLYSSYYPAPDVIILNDSNSLNSFLLWDSAYARIIITGKKWPDFSGQDFKRAIEKESVC